MDISTLMEIGGGNLKLEVTAADLTKFAKDVVDMTLAARSKELTKTGANAINGETYLSSGQVCEKLGIAKSTLSQPLCPVGYSTAVEQRPAG